MKKLFKFILGVILVLLLAYFVVLNIPKAKLDKAEIDHSLTAIELYDQYEKNENKANNSYLGKILKVSGDIQMIERDRAGATVLILNGGDGMGGVMCTMAENNRAALYEENQSVVIKGLCAGKLMDVVMNKCVVVDE